MPGSSQAARTLALSSSLWRRRGPDLGVRSEIGGHHPHAPIAEKQGGMAAGSRSSGCGASARCATAAWPRTRRARSSRWGWPTSTWREGTWHERVRHGRLERRRGSNRRRFPCAAARRLSNARPAGGQDTSAEISALFSVALTQRVADHDRYGVRSTGRVCFASYAGRHDGTHLLRHPLQARRHASQRKIGSTTRRLWDTFTLSYVSANPVAPT